MHLTYIKEKGTGEVCPYGDLIERAIAGEFPSVVETPKGLLLDAITDELVSTGQNRYGPKPGPESLVAIRRVVSKAMEQGLPIPVLSPWGSKKPNNNASVDVADMCGLRMLSCVQKRVRALYEPGLTFNIRVEDVGGLYLFDDEGPEGREANTRYVDDLVKLNRILETDQCVNLVLESTMMSEKDYVDKAYSLVPLLLAYIKDTDEHGIPGYESLQSWKNLSEQGWRGPITEASRYYYRNRYIRWYGSSPEDATYRLAKYLAGSLARYKLNASGAPESDFGFVQVSLAPPVAGDVRTNVISYRTVPMRFTRDHIPPWRAHGYYRIYEDSTVTPAVASQWDDTFNPHSVTLARGEELVEVAADYVVL